MPRSAATQLDSSSVATTAPAPRKRSRSRSSARVQPSAPLGSLTQPGARDGVRCEICDSDCVTRLAMTLTDGTPVSFTSCHRCEHRSWTEVGGDVLGRAAVLSKARKPR